MSGLVAACLLLRVVHITALPIFLDESLYTRATQVVATPPAPQALFTMVSRAYGGNPPLFSWLAAPLLHLVSDPLVATRLTSALIGTLGLLGVWASGRALWGPAAGLLAGALYVLCPFVLFYNRLALLDGLLATCGAGTLFCAIMLARHARTRDALALGLCLAAGLLTKILAVSFLLLPLLAVLAASPAQRRAARRGAAVAVALGLLPFACILLLPYGNDPASFALHGHLQAGSGLPHLLHVVTDQIARWAAGLWLYLTPPVLVLGALGLWSIRTERIARLLGGWALLGSLPVVLAPNRFFVPRHYLFIAVPIVLLAARGLLVVWRELHAHLDASPARLGARTRWSAQRLTGTERTRVGFQPACAFGPSRYAALDNSRTLTRVLVRALLWVVCAAAAGLAAIPAATADSAIVGAPARTPLIPADRFQYVTGWPSGYMLAPVSAYLRRQAARGPIAVLSEESNPPLYMLRIALYNEAHIAISGATFDSARGLRSDLRHAARTGRVYVIVHHSSDRPLRAGRASLPHGLAVLVAGHLLQPVMQARSLDRASSYDVYLYRGIST